MLSIGDDYVSYCKAEKIKNDERDCSVYKQSLYSGETISLNGVMPNFNSASGVYAVCDDAVYMFYESIGSRNLVSVDFQNNNVEIMKKKDLNIDTDSFYFSYPISHKEYAVRWFNFDQNNHNLATHHIVLVDGSNNETEVFTNKIDRSKFISQHSVTNNKIKSRLAYGV